MFEGSHSPVQMWNPGQPQPQARRREEQNIRPADCLQI